MQVWRDGLRQQWGREPGDWDQRLGDLEAFCEFVAKEPDDVIRECTRESEAGKKISVKGRRFYGGKIDEWQASLPGGRFAQQRSGNAIRSFLIHNGIFIQAGIQT